MFQIHALKEYLPDVIKPTNAHIYTKFYLHQLMHFFIQTCISLLSYIKIT